MSDLQYLQMAPTLPPSPQALPSGRIAKKAPPSKSLQQERGHASEEAHKAS